MHTIIDYITQNAATVALLVGLVTPYAVALLAQPSWSKTQRQVASVATAIVFGFVTAVTAGDITDPGNILLVIATTFAASEASYQKLWKPTGITSKVESATSPSRARHAASPITPD